ncbi:L-threonylcarbamoyladenylate synthase [Lederbergia panacisoli]|uniref:L-threonylcarbamoyladenylate synthase n=1 Tax=Lederbergia panacisoli TaxID=1255251 RepID=UPI00214B0C4E|nr:L-threonylcarbamoyladenylate synthase [Lederbergia panacisoli]MCR2821362.1 L-threonylcarbamoyladenylate synthase [Lederbergia panacisoli]
MKTERWSVDKDVDKNKSYPQIKEAASFLHKNEVVAFPTETVYGLGANAKSDEAVAKIFAAKGRPADNPLIVHISSTSQLQDIVASIPEKARKLMDHFWPGPLTIIFQKKQGAVSDLVTAGLDTVALRMPDHPIALELISTSGLPLAAPSANRSGKPSPTAAEHVANDLMGKIAGILDGGPTGVGVESTVIDCTGTTPIILRPGGVSKEEIESIIYQVEVDSSLKNQEQKPKSPGMKYKHYAPAAPLFLADGEPEWLQTVINEKRNQGLKVGVMASSETASDYDADMILDCGSKANLNEVAHSLYHVLRAFDEAQLDIIFSETFPETGVGAAIMNRLDKAAGHNWIRQKARP